MKLIYQFSSRNENYGSVNRVISHEDSREAMDRANEVMGADIARANRAFGKCNFSMILKSTNHSLMCITVFLWIYQR